MTIALIVKTYALSYTVAQALCNFCAQIAPEAATPLKTARQALYLARNVRFHLTGAAGGFNRQAPASVARLVRSGRTLLYW